MTDEEIIQASKLDGIAGITVNERLFASGLMKEFDKAMQSEGKSTKNFRITESRQAFY
jgi:hypothetical protein